jgi:hydrogenase maturation protease
VKTIVLGLGNSMRGDDSAGLHVARALHNKLDNAEITVMETGTDGLIFLELLAGYDRAIIVDAVQTGEGRVGQIYRLEPEAFNVIQYAGTSHNLSFITAIELGKRLGLDLPQQIVIFAIEVKDVDSYCEECTPEVKEAINNCIGMLFKELNKNLNISFVYGSLNIFRDKAYLNLRGYEVR